MRGTLKLQRYHEQWMSRPPVHVHAATVPLAFLLYWEPVELNVYDNAGKLMLEKMTGCRVWLCNEAMDKPIFIDVIESVDKVTKLYEAANHPGWADVCPHGFGPDDEGCTLSR